jgi:enoyl-CoA hydratase/carnithine racemase
MMLLGDPIDAATALAWGLANQVVPAGQSLSSSVTLAEKLLQRPSLAMALCKQAIGYAFDFPERDAIAKALPLSERAFTSSEAHEGVRAFLEKQTPEFPNALHDKD